MRSPVFNGCGSSPDKTYFQMPVHHIHNSVKNDPVLQGNRLYDPYLRPVVYGHFPISSELEPPAPDPFPDPLYCLRDIRQYSTPGKAALSSSFTQYRFYGVLYIGVLDNLFYNIIFSPHDNKLAFNSPGRASSKKVPTKPHCPALYFSPFQP